ncbi:ArnT family glycosyltransferase [Celeribacter indicus]|uniref:Transmembrane protein n=1 Tax=Celeribacter indicus TaxID=1208324 RepID=A0A0B5E0Y0_9RHOB|nr:glycosyltransferase family 39 protein [Celeribacter indicus]AJE48944.1 transmembrane protein [Celeribacter indicus]SDW41902.1 Dolichyl-phosphate-mannose-protein mannosyltransferase [Celeribacter indicus]
MQRDMAQEALFLRILFAYFAIQTVLRTLLGGTFEYDEAEMFVLAQDYRFGYGPQTPLYNWWQATVFHVFGPTTFSIALAKNALLFAAYALTFDALRRLVPTRVAILGTLALLLLPNVSWEGQRAGSHSIAMLALIGATLNVMARRIAEAQSGESHLSHAVALGVAIGLGGLTKYNYWLFPLPLLLMAGVFPDIRRALWRRDLLLTALIALAILAGPYAWILSNRAAAMAQSQTLYHGPAIEGLPRPLLGVVTMLIEALTALALLLLTLVVARLPFGRRALSLEPASSLAKWLMSGPALGFAVIALPVIAFGVTDVQARWLLPLLVPMALGLMLRVAPTFTPRITRNLLRFCAFLALLIVVAMADTRLRGAGSDSLDIEVLAQAIEADLPEGAEPPAVVSFNFYFTGNLKYLRPDWIALANHPSGHVPAGLSRLVVVGIAEPERIRAALAAHELVPAEETLPPVRTATLPYRFEAADVTRDVPYVIVDLKNGAE